MKLVALFACITVFAAVCHGAEPPQGWSRFRGPNGSGVADSQKPPLEFGPDKNLKFKVPVPSGLSSPIVAGDKLFLTAFDAGRLYTIAYKRANGQEAWRAEASAKTIEAFHKTEGSPAASTPVTDGEQIVSYFGSCGLISYDLSGKERWKFELPPAVLFGEFGSGVSPILADGLVILVRDQKKNSKIYAVDAATGLVKWERDRRSPVSYCTPIVWDTPDGKQIVAAGHARMVGYDLKSGVEKWSVGDLPSGCCSSPLTTDGLLLFAGATSVESEDAEAQLPSFDSMLKDLDTNKDGSLSREEAAKAFEGFFDNQDDNKDGKITRDEWDAIGKLYSEGGNSVFALRTGGIGDVTTSHVLWKQKKGLPYLASAIAYRGDYVMVKDGGILTSYDVKTGAMKYQGRTVENGKYYASPVAANGHIYVTSLDGAVTVLRVEASGPPVVVAKNPKLDERTIATPAIADDTLYVRTEKHLYAFGPPQ